MKPGNLFLQGAKSVGDIRKMRLFYKTASQEGGNFFVKFKFKI